MIQQKIHLLPYNITLTLKYTLRVSYSNILVTSSSNKQILISYLKYSFSQLNSNVKIVCTDANNEVLTKLIADYFFQFDNLHSENILLFIDKCKEYEIRLIIPSRNSDALLLSSSIDLFEENGIDVLVSNHVFISKCVDKLIFSEAFRQKSNSILNSSTKIDDLTQDKFVAKERYGSGSVNLHLDLTKENFVMNQIILEDPIFQEMLSGTEFSADLWFNRNYVLHALSVRTRAITHSGEAVVSSFISNNKINVEIKKILNNEFIRGPINLQGFILPNDDIKVFEINPRFGGAYIMNKFVGFEVTKWINEEYIINQPISKFHYLECKDLIYKYSDYAKL